MKNNNENTIKMESKEVKQCREKIVEMVEKIENQRFLKAIYISMSDYLKENEPD